MSLYLGLLGGIAILALVNVILMYRNRVQQQRHAAEIRKTIMDAVLSQAAHRDQLDKSLEHVHEKHRHETIDENAHLADRLDFDNDWGGLPGSGAGYVAPNSGATSAGPAGSAGNIGR